MYIQCISYNYVCYIYICICMLYVYVYSMYVHFPQCTFGVSPALAQQKLGVRQARRPRRAPQAPWATANEANRDGRQGQEPNVAPRHKKVELSRGVKGITPKIEVDIEPSSSKRPSKRPTPMKNDEKSWKNRGVSTRKASKTR